MEAFRKWVWFGAAALATAGAMPGEAAAMSSARTHWERAGRRWAFQVDESGHRLALYDLAYPGPAADRARLPLGRLDLSPEAIERVRQMIRSARDESAEPGTRELADRAIQALERIEIPRDWWRSVPWKDAARKTARSEPSRFKVSEISLAQAASDPQAFEQALKNAESVGELGGGFLNRFEFVREGEGIYVLIYHAPAPPPGPGNGGSPYRLASLEHPSERMWVAVGWGLTEQAFSLAIGQITVPVLGPLIGTATSRFFAYRREYLRVHEAMALEAVESAETGSDPLSPFLGLSAGERAKLAKSLIMGQSSWVTAAQWLVRNPERAWRNGLSTDQRRSLGALDWLKARGEDVQLFNPYYARTTERDGRPRLTILPRARVWASQRPHVAVDYRFPDNTRDLRKGLEAACALVDFSTRYVPYVGSLLNEAFYGLVEKPVRTSQHWEARLSTYLEERAGGGQWARELQILEQQRWNPWALTRDEELRLADHRWTRIRN